MKSPKRFVHRSRRRVDRLLREAHAYGLRIQYVVNTHSHIDHVMGNREMVRKTGAKLIIHEADANGLLHPSPYLLEMFGAEASLPPTVWSNKRSDPNRGPQASGDPHSGPLGREHLSLRRWEGPDRRYGFLWGSVEGRIYPGVPLKNWKDRFKRNSMSCRAIRSSSRATTTG